MTVYWFAQIMGWLAFLIGITAFLNNNENKFKLQLSLYSLIIGFHFFLLNADIAGINAILNTLRTLISTRTRHIFIMLLFIITTLILSLPNIHFLIEILPMISTIANTWALFRLNGLAIRYVIWCSTTCWMIYNIWLGSISGSIIEVSFLIINSITIFRFRRVIKHGINPFIEKN